MNTTKKTIYSPDITCGSCVKVLSKIFEKKPPLNSFKHSLAKRRLNQAPINGFFAGNILIKGRFSMRIGD